MPDITAGIRRRERLWSTRLLAHGRKRGNRPIGPLAAANRARLLVRFELSIRRWLDQGADPGEYPIELAGALLGVDPADVVLDTRTITGARPFAVGLCDQRDYVALTPGDPTRLLDYSGMAPEVPFDEETHRPFLSEIDDPANSPAKGVFR